MSNTRQSSTASRIMLGHNLLILDTETTGLGADAEIIEVGIIDHQGSVVFESLIKPRESIPKAATAIHGISNADVAQAPTWAEVHAQVCGIIGGMDVAIYNAAYDVRLLQQTAKLYGVTIPPYRPWCAMLEYAQWWGEWDDYRESYQWQRLSNAAQQCGINLPTDSQAHRAIYDCRMTLEVMRTIAGYAPGDEIVPFIGDRMSKHPDMEFFDQDDD